MHGLHVAREWVNRRAHVLAGDIAQHLVKSAQPHGIQPGNGAVIVDADDQRAAPAVGKGHQFGSQSVRMGDDSLELLAAVFTPGDTLQQLALGHGLIAHNPPFTSNRTAKQRSASAGNGHAPRHPALRALRTVSQSPARSQSDERLSS